MKWLLLSFIFLIGILGKTREYFEWQCPSTLGKCPKGCAPQKKGEFNCSKGISYVGPKQCAKSCPYICANRQECKKNECCKNCPKTMVSTECGILS